MNNLGFEHWIGLFLPSLAGMLRSGTSALQGLDCCVHASVPLRSMVERRMVGVYIEMLNSVDGPSDTGCHACTRRAPVCLHGNHTFNQHHSQRTNHGHAKATHKYFVPG